MTKVLVTGMTSRQANPGKNYRDVMVSWLIAEACRKLGFEVEHRNPSVTESLDSFDHVFVGLAPLHALGSNRAYGAMSAILRAQREGKLTLYLDDVDSTKVDNGIRNAVRSPDRFTKEFFRYKLEWTTASESPWREWLVSGIELLHNYPWPRTLVPQFAWSDFEPNISTPAGVSEIVTFDPTPLVPRYEVVKPEENFRSWWVTENNMDNRWMERTRPVLPLVQFGNGKEYPRRPDDKGLVNVYGHCWGVLDAGLPFGWWHSRPVFASHAESLYITDWTKVKPLGDPYMLLADTAAMFTREERDEWAGRQVDAFTAATPSLDSQLEIISNIVERVGASA